MISSIANRPWILYGTVGFAPGPVGNHDHTSAAGSGGVLTNDEHDGYSEYTAITDPSAPAVSKARYYFKTQANHVFPHYVDTSGIYINMAQDNVALVRNVSGSTITKGQAVALFGSTGNTPTIELALATVASERRAVGLALETIANNGFGLIMVSGLITGLNTAAYSEGDLLYLSATTPGVYTALPPTATGAFIQQVAVVTRSHAIQGSVHVAITYTANSIVVTPGSVLFAGSNGLVTIDNANFYWDDTNNRLGLRLNTGLLSDLVINNGPTAEEAPDISYVSLHAQGNETAGSGYGHIYVDSFGNSASPSITMRRSRGTQASKSALLADDAIFNFRVLGYHSGGAYTTTIRGAIRFSCAENWTSSAQGSYLMFLTTPKGAATTATEVVRITPAGNLLIGVGDRDPTTGARCLILRDGTVPATLVSDTAIIYADTLSAVTQILAINSSGETNQLSGDIKIASGKYFYTQAASFMIRGVTAYTNGAAANAGTLTNAPSIGNPTKWIPIDDAGVTRYIPAW